MRLFSRKKDEEPEALETEMKDLDKLTTGEDSVEIPELPPELTRIKQTAEAEAEKITEKLEKPKTIPTPTETKQKIEFEELPLKELNEKIDKELEDIKKRMKDLGNLNKLTLESPEMITLMDLYTEYKDKLSQFTEEINQMNLTALASKKTFAAIYKFRACKSLSEIKKQINKIEALCKKSGFIPTKVHDILESRVEDLVNGFLKKSKDE